MGSRAGGYREHVARRLIDALYLQNRFAETRTLCEEEVRRTPAGRFAHYCLGATAARLGDRAVAEREIMTIQRLEGPRDAGPRKLYPAQIAALLGDRDRVMSLLQDAYASGAVFPGPERLMDFESMRDYPPFKELLRPKG